MRQVLVWYMVVLLALFLLVTALASMETAWWTLCFLYVSCALSACLCIWWKQRTFESIEQGKRRWGRVEDGTLLREGEAEKIHFSEGTLS